MSNPKGTPPDFGQPRLESPVIDATYTVIDPSPAAQDGPGKLEKGATMAWGVAAFLGQFAKDAIHQGTQEAVSQFLGLENSHAQLPGAKDPEPAQEQAHDDRDRGMDR